MSAYASAREGMGLLPVGAGPTRGLSSGRLGSFYDIIYIIRRCQARGRRRFPPVAAHLGVPEQSYRHPRRGHLTAKPARAISPAAFCWSCPMALVQSGRPDRGSSAPPGRPERSRASPGSSRSNAGGQAWPREDFPCAASPRGSDIRGAGSWIRGRAGWTSRAPA